MLSLCHSTNTTYEEVEFKGHLLKTPTKKFCAVLLNCRCVIGQTELLKRVGACSSTWDHFESCLRANIQYCGNYIKICIGNAYKIHSKTFSEDQNWKGWIEEGAWEGFERGSGQIPTNRFLGIQGILIPSTPHVYPRVPMRPRSPNTLGPGIQIMVIAPAF